MKSKHTAIISMFNIQLNIFTVKKKLSIDIFNKRKFYRRRIKDTPYFGWRINNSNSRNLIGTFRHLEDLIYF